MLRYATIGLAALALPTFAQQPTAAERAAMLKATMAASEAALKKYQWIETTVVTVKGDQKSRKQERCFYGDDGKLTKVLLDQSAPPPEPHGFLRRRIAEKEKKELEEKMQRAVALVRMYVPPNEEKIQACKESGNVNLQLTQPGKRARLTFSDYLKPGDTFALDVDLTNNHPLSANVNTYLDSPDEPVILTVSFGTLDDGTVYPSQSVLNLKSKKLRVTINNSGYEKNKQ
jgi:hypothetical protein